MADNNLNTADVDSLNVSIVGTTSHYNGLLFGYMSAVQADCEGALAIGGDALLGSDPYHGYDVGAASGPEDSILIGTYDNPNGYPTLLLRGSVSSQGIGVNIYAGNVVMTLSNKEGYEQNSFRFGNTGVPMFVDDEIVEEFFRGAKQQVLYTSDVLSQGSSKTIGLSAFQRIDQLNLNEYKNENIRTNANMLVFNVDCSDTDSINMGEIWLSDEIDDYDTVVINVPAAKVTFSGGVLYNGILFDIFPRNHELNRLVRLLASKIIFNLPNANEVNLFYYGMLGSLIAPNATVTGLGGSVNGMLIADSLYQQGGMEIHAFTISMGDDLWKLRVGPPLASITIIKTDSDDPEITIAGAVFLLYKKNEETNEYEELLSGLITAPDGSLLLEDLEPGDYKLIETQAPEGYVLPENVETSFKILLDKEGEVILMDTIFIKNKLAAGNVQFVKADSENQEITLAGAIFTLYKYNEETSGYEVVSTGHTTLADGIILLEDLLPGRYKLVETQSPEGYYLSDNAETMFAISLDENGELIELETIIILNTLLGSITIIKIDDSDPDVVLKGAVFNLYKYNQESSKYEVVITGLTTDEDGSLLITDLEPGNYKLVETTAPHGYQRPEDSETLFTITL